MRTLVGVLLVTASAAVAGIAAAEPLADACAPLPTLPAVGTRSVCASAGAESASFDVDAFLFWADGHAGPDGACVNVLSYIGCGGPEHVTLGDAWNEPWVEAATGPEPGFALRLPPYVKYESGDGVPPVPSCIPATPLCAATGPDGSAWASLCVDPGCTGVTRTAEGDVRVDASQRYRALDTVVWLGGGSYETLVLHPDATADADAAYCPASGVCYDVKAWLGPDGAHGRYGDALLCIILLGCPPRGGWEVSPEGASAHCVDTQQLCQFWVAAGATGAGACKSLRVPLLFSEDERCVLVPAPATP